MEISYFGDRFITLSQKNLIVACDATGKKKVKAHIATFSTPALLDEDAVEIVSPVESEQPFIIDTPGGYEVKGVLVEGYASFADDKKGEEKGYNTIFFIQMGNMNICHLGDLGDDLESSVLDELESIDILFIPIASLGAKKAAKIIGSIEPRVIIPIMTDAALTAAFAKEIGLPPQEVESVKIEPKDLPQEGQLLYVLQEG